MVCLTKNARYGTELSICAINSLGEHIRSPAISIPPAKVSLNLSIGHFERNREMGTGEGVSSDESESEYLNTIVYVL